MTPQAVRLTLIVAAFLAGLASVFAIVMVMVGPTRGPIVASPVAAGDRFLVGSTDGGLYLIGSDGQVLQRSDLAASGVQSSAALGADPIAFVGSGDGLHALRLRG